MFVGDSLSRNMWESLVCILKGSVKDERQVFEARRRHHFRWEAEYSFVFKVSLQSISLRHAGSGSSVWVIRFDLNSAQLNRTKFGSVYVVRFLTSFTETNQSFWFQLYFGLKFR